MFVCCSSVVDRPNQFMFSETSLIDAGLPAISNQRPRGPFRARLQGHLVTMKSYVGGKRQGQTSIVSQESRVNIRDSFKIHDGH